MDDLDLAADRAEIERMAALSRHAARTQSPVGVCEACSERPVHVTTSGTRWRFCIDCAEDHLRRSQTA